MTDYDGKDRPEHYELPDGDERTELRNGIVRALYALPMHFTSPINVEGIEVNDLFSINTLLGGTIEAQTVMLLNSLRSIWDPQGKWADKEFRPRIQFVSATLVFGLAAFDCSLAISSSHTSLGVL